MHELIRLLTEFGADNELIAIAERFVNADESNTNAEPLTDDELDSLLNGLKGLGSNDEASADLLREAFEVASAVHAEQVTREEAYAEAEAERQRQVEALAALGTEDPSASDADPDEESDEPEADDGDENDGDGDEPAAEAEAPAPEAQPEPIAAAAAPARRPAARRTPPARRTPRDAQPVETDHAAEVRMTFGADLAGIAAGSRAGSLVDIDRAVFTKAKSYGKTRANGRQQVHVATIERGLPDERRLTDSQGRPLAAHEITERVESVIASAIRDARSRNGGRALVAAGGLCAPLTPIYSVETLGETGRPVRDTALVSFQASRGGVISTIPPTISSVTSAVGAWTVTNDEDAAPDGDPVKPKMRIDCGTTRETEIEAIVHSLVFGNMLARTYGEWVDAVTTAVMVAQDRFAEARHLAAMRALSTVTTPEDAEVSATLDVLDVLTRAAAGIRSRHRLSRDYPFRVILPEILFSLMQTDLSRRMPGGSMQENLAVSDALLNQAFAARGFNVTWSPDLNVQAAQSAGAMAEWPDEFQWLVYPEGTFIHLDAGELDLGLYRDSALNAVNDAEVFAETFEAVHMLGVESIAGTARVCPSGAVTGTIDPAELCGANS